MVKNTDISVCVCVCVRGMPALSVCECVCVSYAAVTHTWRLTVTGSEQMETACLIKERSCVCVCVCVCVCGVCV